MGGTVADSLLALGGLFVIWLFFEWQQRRRSPRGAGAARSPGDVPQPSTHGRADDVLLPYLVQAGFFFVVPLYLSVALGLSAIETGVKILPLSVTLLAAAIGIPRFLPQLSPRLVVRAGLLSLLAGTVDPARRARPGRGGGGRLRADAARRAGDRGARVAARRRDRLGRAGRGEARRSAVSSTTCTANLGASLGTALAGSLLIATLTSAFIANIQQNPAIPASAKEQAAIELAGGVPFVSDVDSEAALDEANIFAGDDRGRTRRVRRRRPRASGRRSRSFPFCPCSLCSWPRASRRDRWEPEPPKGRSSDVPLARVLGLADQDGGAARTSRDRSLIDQSLNARQGATTTNGDGFGVGWYDEGWDTASSTAAPTRPGTTAISASSPAGISLAALLRAHPRLDRVRRSRRRTTYPVRHGRWLWMHNGLDPRVPAGQSASSSSRSTTSLYPVDRGHDRLGGDVRSRAHVRAGRADPIGAVERMVGLVEETGRKHGVEHPIQMTVATSDGQKRVGFPVLERGALCGRSTSVRAMDSLKAVYPEIETLRRVVGRDERSRRLRAARRPPGCLERGAGSPTLGSSSRAPTSSSHPSAQRRPRNRCASRPGGRLDGSPRRTRRR